MKLIYNKLTGEAVGLIGKDQNVQGFFRNYDDKEHFAELECDDIPRDFSNYKILENKLVKKSEQEIEELQRYHRILSDEERLLNQLKPPAEEIQKAQNTIEILTLIQEVM